MIEEYVNQEDEEFKFTDSEKEKKFYSTLDMVINDRWWCCWHGIDYTNPDIKIVAQKLYNELFSERKK